MQQRQIIDTQNKRKRLQEKPDGGSLGCSCRINKGSSGLSQGPRTTRPRVGSPSVHPTTFACASSPLPSPSPSPPPPPTGNNYRLLMASEMHFLILESRYAKELVRNTGHWCKRLAILREKWVSLLRARGMKQRRYVQVRMLTGTAHLR